jgi:hypothetical protein
MYKCLDAKSENINIYINICTILTSTDILLRAMIAQSV